MFLTAIARFF